MAVPQDLAGKRERKKEKKKKRKKKPYRKTYRWFSLFVKYFAATREEDNLELYRKLDSCSVRVQREK